MPRLEYFLVCRSIQTDIHTNEISLINVLEDITPEAFPHVIHSAIAVSLWNFQDSEDTQDHQAILVVKIPNLPDASFRMNFTSDAHRCRAYQGVLDIPIEAPCDVTFEVRLNGEHAACHIVKIHPPEVRAAAGGGEQMPGRENNQNIGGKAD